MGCCKAQHQRKQQRAQALSGRSRKRGVCVSLGVWGMCAGGEGMPSGFELVVPPQAGNTCMNLHAIYICNRVNTKSRLCVPLSPNMHYPASLFVDTAGGLISHLALWAVLVLAAHPVCTLMQHPQCVTGDGDSLHTQGHNGNIHTTSQTVPTLHFIPNQPKSC